MGAKLSSEGSKKVKVTPLSEGSKKVQVTPLSLGICVRGGLMSILIPRNTSIPTKVEKVFITTIDNQTGFAIRVCEGERVRWMDNILLGKFRLSELPPAPKGLRKMKVCFEINANGILTVSAQVMASGNQAEEKVITFTKVTNTYNKVWPSKEQIKRMIQTSNKHKSEDLKHEEKVKAWIALEDYIYNMEKTLKDQQITSKLVPSEKERMECAIEKAKSYKSPETKEEIQWMVKELMSICDAILLQNKQVDNVVSVMKS